MKLQNDRLAHLKRQLAEVEAHLANPHNTQSQSAVWGDLQLNKQRLEAAIDRIQANPREETRRARAIFGRRSPEIDEREF